MKEHTNGQKKLPTDCMLYERLRHLDFKRNWANGLLLLTRDHTSWTLCLTQSNGQGRRSKGKKRKIGWKGFQERIIAHGGNIEQDQCIALQCSLQNNQDKTRQTHRYSKNSSNEGDQRPMKQIWRKIEWKGMPIIAEEAILDRTNAHLTTIRTDGDWTDRQIQKDC